MKKIGLIIFITALAIGVIVANVFSFGSFSFKSPFSISIGKIKGSGNFVTEKRQVSDFTKVDVSGAFEVEIIAQKDFAVEVDADDNLLKIIKTEVKGDTLEIGRDKSFSSRHRIKIRVYAPNIEDLDVSGASKINLVNINNESLNIETSGASSVKIKGQTENLTLDMSGASQIEAKDLSAKQVSVDGSGASQANIFVSETLSADLSGASQVKYSGNPTEINKNTSGGSCLKQN